MTSPSWWFVPSLALACVLAAAALAPDVARAQRGGVDPTAAARTLFTEGVAFADRGRWPEAADRFERALALRPSPQIAFNLAQALSHLGQLVRATELLRGVGRDPTADARVKQAAADLLAQVEPRVGRMTIRVTGDPAGVAISVDDEPFELAMLGVAVPIDPGTHRVVVRHGDETIGARELRVADGGSAEAVFDTAPAPSAPTPDETARLEADREASQPPVAPAAPERQPESGGILSKWWFWTGALVIVAGATAGVVVATTSGGDPDPVRGSGSPPVIFVGNE